MRQAFFFVTAMLVSSCRFRDRASMPLAAGGRLLGQKISKPPWNRSLSWSTELVRPKTLQVMVSRIHIKLQRAFRATASLHTPY